MRIRLLAVGKTSKGWVKDALDIYASRLSHYAPFTVTELPDVRGASSLSPSQIKAAEAVEILSSLKDSDFVILLDEHGEEFTSMEYSARLQKYLSAGRDLVYVIGGSYGFDPSVRTRAGAQMSLSRMTFSHQMVRVFFTEQLYRAFTILKGEPYHNE